MAIHQSSVPSLNSSGLATSGGDHKSSTNQEVLGDPSAGEQPQNQRYFTNEEHNLWRHQKELLRWAWLPIRHCVILLSVELVSAMQLQNTLININ